MNSTIKDVCRLCASSGYNYYPIFDTNANSIVEKIHNCLPLVIHSNDKLPVHICNICLKDLDTSDKLRSRCLRADSILRKQLEDPIINNIKPEDNPHGVKIKTERDPLETSFEELNTSSEYEVHSDWNSKSCSDEVKSSDVSAPPKKEKHYVDSEVEEDFKGFDHLMQNNCVECKIEIEGEYVTAEELIPIEDEPHCDICNVTIRDKQLRQFHAKFHEARSMDCYNCWHTFPSPYELYIHKKTDHFKFANIEMKWFCDKCEKMTDKSEWARRHMTQCVKQKSKYHCKYCNQEFVYKKEFLSHQRKEHYNIVIRDPTFTKFECKLCNKSYIDKRSYHRHVRVHETMKKRRYAPRTDSRKYYCEQCGANFKQMRLLRDHHNIHTGKRPYACKPCKKTFRTYSGFYTHRQSHENHTFSCDYCKQIFINKRTLVEHISIHEKPENWNHCCEICNVKFPVRGILERHMKKFKDTHLLTCDLCGIQFLGMHRLRKHRHLKHDMSETNNYYAVKKEEIT